MDQEHIWEKKLPISYSIDIQAKAYINIDTKNKKIKWKRAHFKFQQPSVTVVIRMSCTRINFFI